MQYINEYLFLLMHIIKPMKLTLSHNIATQIFIQPKMNYDCIIQQ